MMGISDSSGIADLVEHRRVVQGVGVLREEPRVEEPGQAHGQDVEDHADDHLVDEVDGGEDGQQQTEQQTGDRRGKQAEVGVLGDGPDEGGQERTHEELSLDVDVDHAGALAQDARHGAEDERDGEQQRALQQARHRQGGIGRGPGQERRDQAEPDGEGGPPQAAVAGEQPPADAGGRDGHQAEEQGPQTGVETVSPAG